jgi:undecaprenyl diphosphate synthase
MSKKIIFWTLCPLALGVIFLGWKKFYSTGSSVSRFSGDEKNFPKSIAIIMDGNGRWAKKRHLPVSEGHRKGMEALEKILDYVRKIGVKSMTIYAFSTENWERAKSEIDYIMGLVNSYLDKNVDVLIKNNVKLRVIGNLDRVSPEMRSKILAVEKNTVDNDGFFLNIAFSYGGRSEIVDAARSIALEVKKGELEVAEIDENIFKRHLYNPAMVYPDLVIRTGGNLRISNFLLWEISYSELYFTNTLWPDFDEKALNAALEDFINRKRTYGKKHS